VRAFRALADDDDANVPMSDVLTQGALAHGEAGRRLLDGQKSVRLRRAPARSIMLGPANRWRAPANDERMKFDYLFHVFFLRHTG